MLKKPTKPQMFALCFCIALGLLIALPKLMSSRINAVATHQFGDEFCWLTRVQGHRGGDLGVQFVRKLEIPIYRNFWDQIFPYWELGQQPMHFGAIQILQDGHYKIHSWSYKKFDFEEFTLRMGQEGGKWKVCREIVSLRAEHGIEEFESQVLQEVKN